MLSEENFLTQEVRTSRRCRSPSFPRLSNLTSSSALPKIPKILKNWESHLASLLFNGFQPLTILSARPSCSLLENQCSKRMELVIHPLATKKTRTRPSEIPAATPLTIKSLSIKKFQQPIYRLCGRSSMASASDPTLELHDNVSSCTLYKARPLSELRAEVIITLSVAPDLSYLPSRYWFSLLI